MPASTDPNNPLYVTGDRIQLLVPKGTKDRWFEHARRTDERTLVSYVKSAVEAKIRQDKADTYSRAMQRIPAAVERSDTQ